MAPVSPEPLRTVRTIAEMRALTASWRSEGLLVGCVPTMGALHEGHLALVKRAADECDRVVTTIFVNPLQFGPREDFARYPRDEQRDLARLGSTRCDAVFSPAVAEMIPELGTGRPATVLRVAGLSERLCGAHRPGHFDGVATIVAKLLVAVAPDVSYWGEKDYQQLLVVQQVVKDLHLPQRVVPVETVREVDGLAMSSRNAYLSAIERAHAAELYRTLRWLATELAPDPAAAVAPILARARERLVGAGFDRVDYLEVVDAESLQPLTQVDRPARAVVAAWLGETRLIDNLPCGPSPTPGQVS